MYACLAVTCHLHFRQNDRDFLRATVVTRGWNGYRNKSQHRKSILEKKILPPFQQWFEPATFQSRVRCSNRWAIPAPLTQLLRFDVFVGPEYRLYNPVQWAGRPNSQLLVQNELQSSGAVRKSRWLVTGSPSLIVLTVSVDVEATFEAKESSQSSGAVCEGRGGCHGLPVPYSPCGLCGRQSNVWRRRENFLRAQELCVKVEVAVLDSPS